MSFKGAVVLGPVVLNATGSATTLIGATSNTGAITIGNTSSGAVAVNCGTAGLTLGTSANAHTTTLGSNNATSSTTVQSGSGALNVTSTNGPLTINSGTGDLFVSTDNSNTTLRLGTGPGNKDVGIGTQVGTSVINMYAGSGGFQLQALNSPVGLIAGTGSVNIANDSTSSFVNVGTGAGAKTVTLGSTNTTSTTTVQSGSGAINLTSTSGNILASTTGGQFRALTGTGTVSLSTDATNNSLLIGTGAGNKSVTVGSLTGSSSLALRCGTGNTVVTCTNSQFNVVTGTGSVNISNDSTNNTVNVGSGSGSKVVTVGSTNTTSSLALKYGTADFTMASATGTVMSALDTGEITKPLQPAFLATHGVIQSNVTGNSTVATVNFTTEVFDQNSDYDGTNTFTAPVTGRYAFYGSVSIDDIATGASGNVRFVTSNRSYLSQYMDVDSAGRGTSPSIQITLGTSAFADMDLGDAALFKVVVTDMAGDTVDLPVNNTQTYFGGYLAC